MKEEVYIEPTASRSPAFLYRRISWGAIFAGLFVTIVVQLMLTLLGVTIGAATINPTQEQDPAAGLAIGSAVWMLVTGLISMFIGACVAGRLCGGPRRADGMLHGLVTWSAATLAMIFMLVTTAGALVGGLGTLVGGALGQPSGAQDQSLGAAAMGQIREAFPSAGALLPPTGRTEGTQTPGELTALATQDAELAAALARLQRSGGATAAPAERDQVVSILTTKHGMDQQQAANLVAQWDQQVQQAKQQMTAKAREAGEKAASGLSMGALWAFIALALGAAVSAWGGWAGTASLPRRIETPVAAA
ncbi:MAG: hypothetical protein EHM39_07110 [Chloroflexi bacterium]|nr:MAG: hypothetical protein EHM39_07110 [Chloroflexota bacterium]